MSFNEIVIVPTKRFFVCSLNNERKRSIYNIIETSKYSEKVYENYITNPIIGKKTIWDPLGDKLSSNEKACPVIIESNKFFTIRLDGKNFRTVVPELRRLGIFSTEYSVEFEEIMVTIAKRCSKMFEGVVDIFTQSDEITIVVRGKSGIFDHEFGGRRDKIISLSAGEVSSMFVKLIIEKILLGKRSVEEKLKTTRALPVIRFDSRIGTYDTYADAFELIIWRGYDCSVNGLSQSLYLCGIPGARNEKMHSDQKLRFLEENGLLPLREHQSYGTLLKREKIECTFLCKNSKLEVTKDRFIVRQIPGQIIRNVKEGVIKI